MNSRSTSALNPFGEEGYVTAWKQNSNLRIFLRSSLGESCYYSDEPNERVSMCSLDSQCNTPFFNSKSSDLSESDRSRTVTPLPDMEVISISGRSDDHRKTELHNNPFLEDVVNPFVDYTPSKLPKKKLLMNCRFKKWRKA